MRIERISEENRREVNCFLEEHWFTTTMALRGELVDMTAAAGFALFDGGEMRGLVTYRMIDDDAVEILSLDSCDENKGIGTTLVETMVDYAQAHEKARLVLAVTNDNINALRFLQKRGFVIRAVHTDTIARGRTLKPEIPLIGYNGIPIQTEIEMERRV